MIVIDLHSVFHENSSALIRESRIAYTIKEERLAGVKQAPKASAFGSWNLSFNSGNSRLEEPGVTLGDIEHTVYSFKPQLLRIRNLLKEWSTFRDKMISSISCMKNIIVGDITCNEKHYPLFSA